MRAEAAQGRVLARVHPCDAEQKDCVHKDIEDGE